MEAIKHIVRTPKNHRIQMKLPHTIPENALIEIIRDIYESRTLGREDITALEN